MHFEILLAFRNPIGVYAQTDNVIMMCRRRSGGCGTGISLPIPIFLDLHGKMDMLHQTETQTPYSYLNFNISAELRTVY